MRPLAPRHCRAMIIPIFISPLEGEVCRPRARNVRARASSSWQSQNRTEVNLMWDRLEELAQHEEASAAAQGRPPRLHLLRGYEVKALTMTLASVNKGQLDALGDAQFDKHYPKLSLSPKAGPPAGVLERSKV